MCQKYQLHPTSLNESGLDFELHLEKINME